MVFEEQIADEIAVVMAAISVAFMIPAMAYAYALRIKITKGFTNHRHLKTHLQIFVYGSWLLHCHVNDHIDAGMLALYRVTA